MRLDARGDSNHRKDPPLSGTDGPKVGIHPIAKLARRWNNRRPMKHNKDTPLAKVSPRGNGSQSPKGSQIKRAGKTENSTPPDTHAAQDHTQQSMSLSAEEIAARAYIRYQNRAAADGDHLEDWLRAEAELAAERDPS
jgi:hypothetical protein